MTYTVSISNRHRSIRPAYEPLRRLMRLIFRREGKKGSMALILTTSQHILSLNRQFRGRKTTTDVLSFPFGEPGAPDETGFWGEVYVNLDYLGKTTRRSCRRLQDELALRITHGMLHLFGYDHERDKDAAGMAAREQELMTLAGFTVSPWEEPPIRKPRRSVRRRHD